MRIILKLFYFKLVFQEYLILDQNIKSYVVMRLETGVQISKN